MSDITVINDSEQSSLVTNGLAKNGELYLKAAGSTDAGAIVVYDSGVWRTFANEAVSFVNGYTLSLDGTDDYARLTGMTLSGAFTASFWFNPLSHAMGAGDLFMTKGYDSSSLTSETDWKLDYANGGFRYSVYDRTQSWATKLEATHTFSFSANTWYHIMITYDGGTSTSGMGLFVDGVSKTLTTATQNPSFTGNNSTSATAVNVGSSSQWSGGKLTGLIDEVAFWETDQSANISSIYTGTAPIDLSGLSTAPNDWFRFENNTDNSISGGSGSASLVNGPTYSTSVPS
jgi:hypothetical protein